jgi:hypothetical protein
MGQPRRLYADSPSVQLLEPWMRRYLPNLDETVIRRLIQLTTGIFEQRSALVERIAEGSAFTATAGSNVTQVGRILRDERIPLEAVYYPLIQRLLAEMDTDMFYIAMDESSHQGDFHLFQVGLVTDAIVLPLGCFLYATNAVWADDARTLLTRIATLVPTGKTVIVLADRLHTGRPFLTCIEQIGWHYIFRVASDTYVETKQGWKMLRSLTVRAQEGRFVQQVRIWKSSSVTTNISIYRHVRPGFRTVLWFLVSSVPACQERFAEYACRWWQECGFKTAKSGLFDWEQSRVMVFRRIEVLLIGMYCALWALWLLGRGHEHIPQRKATTIRPQQRRKNVIKQGIAVFVNAVKHKQGLTLSAPPAPRVLSYARLFTGSAAM